jgi:hypothetical protein
VAVVPATRVAVWPEATSLLRSVGIAPAAVRIGKASTPVTTGRVKTIGKASTLTAITTTRSSIGYSAMARGSGFTAPITMLRTTAIGSVVGQSPPAIPIGGTAITPVGITIKFFKLSCVKPTRLRAYRGVSSCISPEASHLISKPPLRKGKQIGDHAREGPEATRPKSKTCLVEDHNDAPQNHGYFGPGSPLRRPLIFVGAPDNSDYRGQNIRR